MERRCSEHGTVAKRAKYCQVCGVRTKRGLSSSERATAWQVLVGLAFVVLLGGAAVLMHRATVEQKETWTARERERATVVDTLSPDWKTLFLGMGRTDSPSSRLTMLKAFVAEGQHDRLDPAQFELFMTLFDGAWESTKTEAFTVLMKYSERPGH